MEYIHLTGTEQVSNAAYTMRDAANEMIRAANIIDQAHYQHQQFMNDWLINFQNIAKDLVLNGSQR